MAKEVNMCCSVHVPCHVLYHANTTYIIPHQSFNLDSNNISCVHKIYVFAWRRGVCHTGIIVTSIKYQNPCWVNGNLCMTPINIRLPWNKHETQHRQSPLYVFVQCYLQAYIRSGQRGIYCYIYHPCLSRQVNMCWTMVKHSQDILVELCITFMYKIYAIVKGREIHTHYYGLVKGFNAFWVNRYGQIFASQVRSW